MDRINRLHNHIAASSTVLAETLAVDPATEVYLSPCDAKLEKRIYDSVLTPAAIAFVTQLAVRFGADVEKLHQKRIARRIATEQHQARPHFLPETKAIRDDPSWQIDPQPAALHDRRVDIGDVSPANREFLLRALNSGAQGVQVDFDDGHCPTWKNTLSGHWNIMEATRGTLAVGSADLTLASQPALLIIRPRAWNMDEMNMLVLGKVVSGAIFDFALHLFHNGKLLSQQGRGPFLYLPKLESHEEAALWRKIFVYTEERLGLPAGSIKATVLIESIFAAFEMDEILYELRHHSSGLNCGMWDYTASITVQFRLLKECVLPDRQQYVSMQSDFLKHYMELLIRTCQRRSAPATTGMVPFVLSQLPPDLTKEVAISKAVNAKRSEALAGSNGALVYDLTLVKPIQQVFSAIPSRISHQSHKPINESFYEDILLTMPKGFITGQSVENNLRVALCYVLHWFYGEGTVVVNGCVEDSATAEISRAQLWQWIHHQVPLQDQPGQRVDANLVSRFLMTIAREEAEKQTYPLKNLVAAINLVFRVVTMRSPPAFLTTFLLEQEPLTRSLG